MTAKIPSFNVRNLAQPVNDLADNLEFHLNAHISPQLTPRAESLWKTLQGMFVIPIPPGEKRVHYADGTLIGTLTPLDIDKQVAEVGWVEKDGRGLFGCRLRFDAHQKPLFLEVRTHPLLADLHNLDQCVWAVLGCTESSLKLFSSATATRDTVTLLRTLARRLSGSSGTSKRTTEQAAVGTGKKVEQIQKLAEAHISRNPWPGLNAMASLLKCSPATVRKAVHKSRRLAAAEAHCLDTKKKPLRTVSLTDVTLDNTAQSVESEPLAALIKDQEADRARNDRQHRAAKRRKP